MAAKNETQRFGELEPSQWPGERLGLPESGPRSVGRIGRRFLAIIVDWAIASLLTLLVPAQGPASSLVTLAIFAGMQVLFIPTIGGSIGHRLFGLRVVPIVGGWVGWLKPIIRTALILLVIPVLVWDSDQRGFHDKIAGTVLIRL